MQKEKPDIKKKTHLTVFVGDNEKILNIKDKLGLASVAVVIQKLIAQFGDKVK